jgi:hypothetical protein
VVNTLLLLNFRRVGIHARSGGTGGTYLYWNCCLICRGSRGTGARVWRSVETDYCRKDAIWKSQNYKLVGRRISFLNPEQVVIG